MNYSLCFVHIICISSDSPTVANWFSSIGGLLAVVGASIGFWYQRKIFQIPEPAAVYQMFTKNHDETPTHEGNVNSDLIRKTDEIHEIQDVPKLKIKKFGVKRDDFQDDVSTLSSS